MERIKLALQGYNFGNGYISWAKTNYGGYDSVLLRILLYQRRVGFDLRTDRGIGSAVAAAPEQGNGASKQDDQRPDAGGGGELQQEVPP